MPRTAVILLTRAVEDNASLAQGLRENGVPVHEIPCIETHIKPPTVTPPMTDAIAFGSRRSVAGFLAAGLALLCLAFAPAVVTVPPAGPQVAIPGVPQRNP